MSKKGYILLDRQILDNFLWNDKPFSKGQAWIDLILMVNHNDNTILFNGKPETVKRGQTITSLAKLSANWGWSVGKVSRFLNMLENETMITQKRNSERTALSIVNYNVFQDLRKANGKATKCQRNADETPTETNNTLNTLNTLKEKELAHANEEDDGLEKLRSRTF